MRDKSEFLLTGVADAVHRFFQNMDEDAIETNLKELASRFLWHQAVDEDYWLHFEDDSASSAIEWYLTLEIKADRYNEVWIGEYKLSRRDEQSWFAPLRTVVEFKKSGQTSTLEAVDGMRYVFHSMIKESVEIPTRVKLWVEGKLFPRMAIPSRMSAE